MRERLCETKKEIEKENERECGKKIVCERASEKERV